jgi:hypothetical protein
MSKINFEVFNALTEAKSKKIVRKLIEFCYVIKNN